MLRRTPRAAVALLGFAAASFGASRAALAGQKIISGPATLGGTQVYDELLVDTGVLTVTPYKAGVMDSGKLTIKANKITVAAAATISAVGAGYPGVDLKTMNGTGMAEMGTSGGGKASVGAGLPGGGGGYFGNGASGLDTNCALYAAPDDKTFGLAFYMSPANLTLGSAGGALNNAAAAVTRGGNGGGMIILEAAEIVIDGTVSADGESPMAQSGVAPGGGSGGTIQLLTSILSGAGTLSARGGKGGTGIGNNGGGGSGGVIYITGPAPMAPLVTQVDGGATGTCGAMHDGALGKVIVNTPLPTDMCVDVDGDSYRSMRCGGPDCDDSNDQVHPGGKEMCDGLDNDCMNGVDDGDLCQPGEYCEPLEPDNQLHCVVITDGGADAGRDAGAPPDHVEFGGGCGVTPLTGEDVPWWLGGALPALSALGLALRGRSSRRRRGSANPPANS